MFITLIPMVTKGEGRSAVLDPDPHSPDTHCEFFGGGELERIVIQ